MRYFVLVLLILSGCAGQDRGFHAPDTGRADPWANYEPGPRRYYDDEYVPPQRRPAAHFVAEARAAEAAGRDDRARVEYHTAFLRDRWHVEANLGYQELMLRNGLETRLWQEYLDLWTSHPGRGDAFYFHLRVLFEQRGQEVPRERRRARDDGGLARARLLLARAEGHEAEGDLGEALAAVETGLEAADLPELHLARIRVSAAMGRDVAAEYAQRADADPGDGDAVALHAFAIAATDGPEALRLLRDGYVLGLPGYWLYFVTAELCARNARAMGEPADADSRRQAAGWWKTAAAMWRACLRARPNDPAVAARLRNALTRLAALEDALD